MAVFVKRNLDPASPETELTNLKKNATAVITEPEQVTLEKKVTPVISEIEPVNLEKKVKPVISEPEQVILEKKVTPVIPEPEPEPKPDPDRLKEKILEMFSESRYCDIASFEKLMAFALGDCVMNELNAKATIEIEFENNHILHELKKIEELNALLQRFTQQDKKLDAKEREDAIQKVSRKKAGYSKALNPEVVVSYLDKFCRDNGVKVKTGLFKWEIP
jgi:DNA topoisomerase VI subunit B